MTNIAADEEERGAHHSSGPKIEDHGCGRMSSDTARKCGSRQASHSTVCPLSLGPRHTRPYPAGSPLATVDACGITLASHLVRMAVDAPVQRVATGDVRGSLFHKDLMRVNDVHGGRVPRPDGACRRSPTPIVQIMHGAAVRRRRIDRENVLREVLPIRLDPICKLSGVLCQLTLVELSRVAVLTSVVVARIEHRRRHPSGRWMGTRLWPGLTATSHDGSINCRGVTRALSNDEVRAFAARLRCAHRAVFGLMTSLACFHLVSGCTPLKPLAAHVTKVGVVPVQSERSGHTHRPKVVVAPMPSGRSGHARFNLGGGTSCQN
eukprot:1840205-Prymnesium_polylepis.1